MVLCMNYIIRLCEGSRSKINSCVSHAALAGEPWVEGTMLAASCTVHVSFSNTYVFDVYKLIAGVGGRFNATDTRAAENDFLGLSRRKAGRCV